MILYTATKIPFMYSFSGNFHIHVSVSDLYIFPGSVHIFSCSNWSWKYINLSQIFECRKWETEHYISDLEITISFLGINKWESDMYIGFSPALEE
jgi:hypothetical protein